MKLFIILILIAITSAAEWKRKTFQEWTQIHKSCDKEYNVPPELVVKAREDKYPPREVFQVVLCILRESGVWSDTEGYSIDRIMIALEKGAEKKNVNKKFLRDSLESCIDKNSEGSQPLDWALRGFKCFKDNEQLFSVLREAQFSEDLEVEED